MRSISKTIMAILLVFLLAQPSEASPKVTQAAICDFKTNHMTVLAVEEFGKPLKLLFVDSDKKVVYSTTFIDGFANRSFAYSNPYLRFRSYKLLGLPSPLIVAVGVSPGGSDVGYEIKLIAEKGGTMTTLSPGAIDLTIQDGLYLGYINAKYGYGMIIWKNIWANEAHYDPHRYQIEIYAWDTRNMDFRFVKYLVTKAKFKEGRSALQNHRLPWKNYRDEVVTVEQEISNLGIEEELLSKEKKKD